MPSPLDVSILDRARAGSSTALEELVAAVGPLLLALVRLRLGPGLRPVVESQDIVQETLVKAMVRFEQFRGSGVGSLFSWLATIANNEIRDQLDYQRRQRRDRTKEVQLDTGIAEQLRHSVLSLVSQLHLREQQLKLEAALERLPLEHRRVIELRKYEELSFGDLAARMNRSPDACRMLLARAMKGLTKELREEL